MGREAEVQWTVRLITAERC